MGLLCRDFITNQTQSKGSGSGCYSKVTARPPGSATLKRGLEMIMMKLMVTMMIDDAQTLSFIFCVTLCISQCTRTQGGTTLSQWPVTKIKCSLRQGVHIERCFISHYPPIPLSNAASRCDIKSHCICLIYSIRDS